MTELSPVAWLGAQMDIGKRMNLRPTFQRRPAFKCSKQRYPDKKAAQGAVNMAMRRKRNRPEGLRIYFCEDCRAWHLAKL